ncbi:MAG TPA: hypothetical protein VHR36_12605, partial [Pyrinomonadaceae bacterium]|jgi:hypothetical protein|nr:hypothetical protein [Pyrinomonadaceae bacterium]
MKMKTKLAVMALCVLSIFAAGYLVRSMLTEKSINFVSSAQAQDQGSRRCSLKTLKGVYGIKFEGQKIGFGPFVSVSRVVFDGDGHFTTNEIGRFNGDSIQRSFTGPYVVNDDCTGSMDFSSNLSNPPHEAHGDMVIVNNGQEFFIVDNEEGWAASGVGKRF